LLQPIGENLLKHESFNSGLVELESKNSPEEPSRYYCCTNKSTFPVWPFVFLYDPEEFTIRALAFVMVENMI